VLSASVKFLVGHGLSERRDGGKSSRFHWKSFFLPGLGKKGCQIHPRETGHV